MERIDELILEYLPEHMQECDWMPDSAKKVLAALCDLLINSQAKDTGIIYANNNLIMKIARIGKTSLIQGIYWLVKYELITTTRGEARTNGKKTKASSYTVLLDNFEKPLVMKTWKDNLAQFINKKPEPAREEPQKEELEEPRQTRPTVTIEEPSSLEDLFSKADKATTQEDLERLKGYMYGILRDHIEKNGMEEEEITELYHEAEERFEQYQVTSLRPV